MMVICSCCGRFYDDGDSARVPEYHPEVDATEYFSACPYCGSMEADEAAFCKECGEWYEVGMVEGNRCIHCLKEKLSADTFIEFAFSTLKYTDTVTYLEDFIFNEYFNLIEYPGGASSLELREWLLELYNRVKHDKDFSEKLYEFMDSNDLWYEFDEWLDTKEKQHD